MDKSEIRFLCYFAYLGPFWLIGLLSGGRASKVFCFHANQGIALFICELACVPVVCLLQLALGKIAAIIATVAALAMFVFLSCKGMLNVSNSKKEVITFLGRLEFLSADSGRR